MNAWVPGYPPPVEQILGVAGNLVRTSGFLGMKRQTFSVILTNYRVIFAEMTKERINALIEQGRQSAKAQGEGFFGQWGAQLGTSFNYHQIYWQMPPDATLAESPNNFAFDRGAIEKVKFKTSFDNRADNQGPSTPDELVLKTSYGKFEFQIAGGLLSDVRAAFNAAGLG